MDISAQASMKNAAKCDNHCELQNSVNQWTFERILHFWVILGSMPASVLVKAMPEIGVCVCSSLELWCFKNVLCTHIEYDSIVYSNNSVASKSMKSG
jgi:hypothetical protein